MEEREGDREMEKRRMEERHELEAEMKTRRAKRNSDGQETEIDRLTDGGNKTERMQQKKTESDSRRTGDKKEKAVKKGQKTNNRKCLK